MRGVGGVAPTYGDWGGFLMVGGRGLGDVGGMPGYRRYFEDGQLVFLTLVTGGRRRWLSVDGARDEVLAALRQTRVRYPFRHHGHVLLDDHLHLLLSPGAGVSVPKLVGSFKRTVLARLSGGLAGGVVCGDEGGVEGAVVGGVAGGVSCGIERGASGGVAAVVANERLWQRRYHDHVIRDADDFARHLDYLHFNPVKHGLAEDPGAWRWSSLAAWRARGEYPQGWGQREPATPHTIADWDP